MWLDNRFIDAPADETAEETFAETALPSVTNAPFIADTFDDTA